MTSSDSAAPLKIIFAGTPEFAAVALQALLNSEHTVIAAYTQPDRPAGRGRKLKASPVKELAQQHAIPVFQPESLKQGLQQQQLADLDADLMIVAAYGLILPQAVLDIPRYGCLNIHASLLPRWRGAAPIQRAILAGDHETGITIMQMNAGLDTGDMLFKSTCPILPEDTGGSLHDRLAELGADAILHTLQLLLANQLKPQPQNDDEATYARKLEKQEACINWSASAEEIERLIRAFNPWPVAYTTLRQTTLRLWQAHVIQTTPGTPPGTVLQCNKQGLDIACGSHVLRITQLQPAGSKVMPIAAFINGHADMIQTGDQLAT